MVEQQLVYKDMQEFLRTKKETNELISTFDLEQNYESLQTISKTYDYIYKSKFLITGKKIRQVRMRKKNKTNTKGENVATPQTLS